MSKAFASQADLADKVVTFTRLSDNAYAYTAEGDPNTGIVIGDDAVMVIDTQATPVMAQDVIRPIRGVNDKPIKYLVNTHHHFDHAGGLRTFLSQGTTIVTHESNKEYYLDILFHPSPWTLKPDRLATFSPMYMISRRPAPIETVGGDTRTMAPYVVTDGVRMLEVFHVQDMAYGPGEPTPRDGTRTQDMVMGD